MLVVVVGGGDALTVLANKLYVRVRLGRSQEGLRYYYRGVNERVSVCMDCSGESETENEPLRKCFVSRTMPVAGPLAPTFKASAPKPGNMHKKTK